eukprot:8336318-Alexandrium_andersonii.AAC.1
MATRVAMLCSRSPSSSQGGRLPSRAPRFAGGRSSWQRSRRTRPCMSAPSTKRAPFDPRRMPCEGPEL